MHNIFGTCVVLTCVAFTAPLACFAQGSPTPSTAPATTTQLPDTVRPTHYDVAIEPDAASLVFRGKVSIFAIDYDSAEGRKRALYTQFANVIDRISVRRERLPAIDAWLARSNAPE